MNLIRPGIDPDPKTVEVRMAALADGGFTAANFGITEQQLRHHLDPRNEPELFELWKIDPKGRGPLWKFLSVHHRADTNGGRTDVPPRPNGAMRSRSNHRDWKSNPPKSMTRYSAR